MTRDELIRLAVECQLVTTGNRDGYYMDALEKFASAVAQAELDALRLEDEECPVCGEVGSLTSCGAEYCGLVSGAPTPPSAPDGWMLVPVEPTHEMLYAAFAADKEYSARMFGSTDAIVSVGAYDHYVAMITAAPKPGEPT